ncbi:hypothetical protein LPC08_18375 [Roseomonas sp. OT10]|uniref:hypothetical protein n=1 Tax=Roseomonas cutis TaxID=2897332 RepID=UPI001E4C68AE|nr:hypothetical protein [Roseomonas sp. OT10]UFN47962.1 hypothetical protein LPC08_18375 [Roseomonas sp. OT10]
MAGSLRAKTSFTAGELAPEMLGRGDTRAYENGARRLRNVLLQPTGGVTRRPGLRHVATLPAVARLASFEFNTEQTYLLAFLPGEMRVFMGDAQVAGVPGPWTAAMLPNLAWTQNADTLLLFHPEMPPQRITRTGHASWTVQGFAFSRAPFYRFAPGEVSLASSALTGATTLTTSADVFLPGHVGALFRVNGSRVRITGVVNGNTATATVEETLPAGSATLNWDEHAFSGARGWPVCAGFHQDRLVLGGSRDLPNRLWLSRSGDLADFDLGTGLDDQGIEFGLVSDQVNAIRAVFSGRHLQVFTSGAEWMVTGDPLTPASIQLTRQTRIGSPVDRMIAPVDVDGSTIFVARSGQSVVEFAYTEVSQAYQAGDLAITAGHLLNTPVATAYDQRRRLLHVAMADGSLATLTLYRAEAITAWTAQETAGTFRSLAEIDGVVWAVVERFGTPRLERFDPALATDAALTGTAATPQDRWKGLSHLNGATVAILADDAPVAPQPVAGGAVTLDDAASAVEVGLPFRHEIEPLPAEAAGAPGVTGGPRRLVSATFRLLETRALSVDVGRGARPVPLRRLDTPMLDATPPRFTGDVTLRAIGWRRDAMRPLWRIEGEAPLAFTLLSVTTDTRMTD